jgi:hypothetical protein
MEDVNDY